MNGGTGEGYESACYRRCRDRLGHARARGEIADIVIHPDKDKDTRVRSEQQMIANIDDRTASALRVAAVQPKYSRQRANYLQIFGYFVGRTGSSRRGLDGLRARSVLSLMGILIVVDTGQHGEAEENCRLRKRGICGQLANG